MAGRFAAVLAATALGVTSLSAQELSRSGITAPANVTAVGAVTSVQVSWTPIAIRGMTYRVLRSPSAVKTGLDLTTPITVATFVDGSVVAGSTYYYQVIAVYSDGSTGAAVPVGVTLAAATVQPTSLSTTTLAAPTTTLAAPTTTLSTNSVIPVAGPAPSGVVVTGTPLVAHLSWNAMANAQRYAVWRGEGTSVSVERTPAGFTGTQFQDVVPDPRVTYRYAVVAYYSNGTSGEAPVVEFTSPPMKNPSPFTVRDQGQGSVAFQWRGVAGAVSYRLDGPGLPNTGFLVTNTNASHAGIPAGPGSWKLVALYPGNYGDYPAATIASTVVRILPAHSQPWLTKNNGPGALVQVQTPAHQVLNDSPGGSTSGNPSGDLLPGYDSAAVTWLSQPFHWAPDIHNFDKSSYFFRPDVFVGSEWGSPDCRNGEDLFYLYATGVIGGSGCDRPGLKLWLDINSPLWGEPEQAGNEAVYGNPGDLGVGRRASCEQRLRGPPVPGLYTVCYATAHGSPPGLPGFNDPQTITHPQAGLGADFILSMVITKDPTGTVFLVLGKNAKYTLSPTVQLDTEGPKLVPFACLSCHGGKYNPITRKVDGASLLPLDPGLLAFASPGDQAAQEEKIRSINSMIHNSDPRSAVGMYIRGLYKGGVSQPGTRAQPDYVPAGWAQQSGFYRSVVRPYCSTCHLAAPTDWNFASWDNFQANAGLIRAAVCYAHTMPHSELQFKAFWTKDTGALYLPGLLAATLGFPSCP
jgi:hypothetical protein